MDAEGTVDDTVSELRGNMELYVANKENYIAPYTTLVTSSMMGKSRHMKEVANHLPSVYICLRREVRGYGYPHPSPSIDEWSLRGAATIVGPEPVEDSDFWFSTLRWSAFILCTIHTLTSWIHHGQFFKSMGMHHQKLEYAWLWKFFAEPPNASSLRDFWLEVQKATVLMLGNYPSGFKAHAYFQQHHGGDVQVALQQLHQCFAERQINNSQPLIFIFDEARTLCEYDAYTGYRIYEEHGDNFRSEPKEYPKYVQNKMFRSFSNFRALRRALRYLATGIADDVPRIFTVFTDTTSRITNFQPASWNDPSLRVPSLPEPGPEQFRPIFTFSSVDIYSRVLNPKMCISSPHDVADPDRLLKFGRAGWYSTYFQGNSFARKANLPLSDMMVLETATSKLLSISNVENDHCPFNFNPREQLTPVNLIKLIAVLAPRLALTIGPYTLEASELIASHLAVLTKTDNERHFLRTIYPSEPILAEASARLTNKYGWANPLSALIHYVHGGIVEAGYRGELLTKIVCLMAMDKALSRKDSLPKNQWRFTQPIPVSVFLNHLIVPLQDNRTFSDGLKGIQTLDNIPDGALNIDDKKLRRFLDGEVFFNHFIRIDVKLSYSMLVHAWNRGAAIMCMTNTKGIDHVIPVMLDTKNEARFGPLHGHWDNPEHIQQARQHISYILINSKNYASGMDQIQAAWATKFSAKNIRDYSANSDSWFKAMDSDLFDETESEGHGTDSEEMQGVEMHGKKIDNVFLSLIQDFGKKRVKEPWVTVERVLKGYTHPRHAHPPLPPRDTQFIVVLKGIGAETYECLKNPNADNDSNANRLQAHTRRNLKELTNARVDYVDKAGGRHLVAMQNIPLVYGDSMLGSEKWKECRPRLQEGWQAELEAHGIGDWPVTEEDVSMLDDEGPSPPV